MKWRFWQKDPAPAAASPWVDSMLAAIAAGRAKHMRRQRRNLQKRGKEARLAKPVRATGEPIWRRRA